MIDGITKRELLRQQKELQKEIIKVQEEIRKIEPNEYEKEIKRLNNEIKRLQKIILDQKCLNEKLQKTNEIVFDYISKIPEVEKAGGIKVKNYEKDTMTCECLKYEIITIPEVQIAVFKGE